MLPITIRTNSQHSCQLLAGQDNTRRFSCRTRGMTRETTTLVLTRICSLSKSALRQRLLLGYLFDATNDMSICSPWPDFQKAGIQEPLPINWVRTPDTRHLSLKPGNGQSQKD